MSIIGNNLLAGSSGGAAGYKIQRSLRFNSADSPILSRTPGSAGNRRKFTCSAWVKRTGFLQSLLDVPLLSAGDGTSFGISGTGALGSTYDDKFYIRNGGSNLCKIPNTAFHDSSAWYHFVLVIDTENSTAADRQILYVNGSRQENFDASFAPNTDTNINTTTVHTIGVGVVTSANSSYTGNFLLAEYNFIDGQALTPSDFGETDSATGAWIPKKYSGTYGTNGFYLNFSDNSNNTATTLGKDSSGNGNNFTPSTTFSVAAGAGNDSLEDTPTNNWCTLNPLTKSTTPTPSNGNLEIAFGGTYPANVLGSFGVSSGKWYWEVAFAGGSSGNGHACGVATTAWANKNVDPASNTTPNHYIDSRQFFYNSGTGTANSTSFAAGDIIGVALDVDNDQVSFYKNGTIVGSAQSLETGETWLPFHKNSSYTALTQTVNYGQRAFEYTVAGFKPLNAVNLPVPTIKNGTEHFDSKLWTGNGTSQTISGLSFQPDWAWLKTRSIGYQHSVYDAVRGDSAGRLATDQTLAEVDRGVNNPSFTSDGITVRNTLNDNVSGQTLVGWFWNAGANSSKTFTVKVVSDSGNKYRFDDFGSSAVTLDLEEGSTYVFDQSDSSNSGHPLRFSTTSDGTHGSGSEYTTGVTTTGTPGSAGAKTTIVVAASAPTLYYYCSAHSGMGGQANTNSTAGASNFAGDIQSTVRVNADAGFSIVKFTPTASSGAFDIGHGLNVTPQVIIQKQASSTGNWHTHFRAVCDTSSKYLLLNGTGGVSTSPANVFGVNLPDSSTFEMTVGASVGQNVKSIAYCFAEVEGYSKFGTYTGTGSATNAIFVNVGFRPAWVLIKRITTADNWWIHDISRDPVNTATKILAPNLSNAEATLTGSAGYNLDFLSNGFRLPTTNVAWNKSGDTYIFMAFARTSFKYANAA